MDWAAKWYEAELDDEVDPASYDPVAVAEARLKAVTYNLRVLCTIRDMEHPDGAMKLVRHLRTAYWTTFQVYALHNQRRDRGWDVPDWLTTFEVEKVSVAVARRWRVDGWYDRDRDVPRRLVATHIGVWKRIGHQCKRSVRRDFNSVALLLGTEVDKLAWALDPDRR